jgi:acyl-CoA synthetase (AMP-forming)/AMP-acid ligase II
MHRMVLDAIGDRKLNPVDSGLRWIESSSAALLPEQKRALEQVYGVPVMQGYGATEAGGMLAPRSFAQQDIPDGSVGKRANEGVVIMDEDGNIVSPGIVGEICVRSSGNIPGYLNNPEADAEAFRNGYYRTGDLGIIDDSDYLFIVGRVLDRINRGGEKFAPAEVEEVLLRHAEVTGVAAFGVHDDKLGQDVWAAVVLKPGARTTAQDLRAYAAAELDFSRVPKRVIVVDELPHNELGKLVRRELALAFGQC